MYPGRRQNLSSRLLITTLTLEHAIAAPGVWENQVGPALLQVLDEEAVQWNTIDVHRINYIGLDNEAPFPVVVCIVGPVRGDPRRVDGSEISRRSRDGRHGCVF